MQDRSRTRCLLEIMNSEDSDMKRNVSKQREYQKKYMGKKKMVSVIFDIKTDKDIISWLEKQENRSEAIRRAIRADIVYWESTKL